MGEEMKKADDDRPERQLDRIEIKDLLLRGIVGINETERNKRQDILINITVWADVRSAAASDDIADTVNYRTISKTVIKLVESSSYFTVEKMAEQIARLILGQHPAAEVEVSVEKPGALRFARSVGVTILRRPEDFTT